MKLTVEEKKEARSDERNFNDLIKRARRKDALLEGNQFLNNKTSIMKKRHFVPDDLPRLDPGTPAADTAEETKDDTATADTSTDEGNGGESED